MTKQELRELDAWIAVNLFGWEWLERENEESGSVVIRKAIFPPRGDAGWIRFNFNPRVWSPARVSTELFSDWDQNCSARDGGKSIPPHGLPYYSVDKSAAMDVLAKCAEAMPNAIVGIGSPMGGESVAHNLGRKTQDWIAGFGKPSNFDVEAETLPLAICLFARKLFEVVK